MKTDKEKIGRLLADYRHTADMTLMKASEKSGLTEACICRYEKGQRLPKINNVGKLARAYGVNPFVMIVKIMEILEEEE